jgi:hypothetical protein
MATKLTPKKPGGEKPEARKAPAKKAAANGPAADARTKPARTVKKRFPAATLRALTELETGALNRYAGADELFRELDRWKGDRRSMLAPHKAATAAQRRSVEPDRVTLTPELARAILRLDFDVEDHRRVDELSAKAQKGTLTADEHAELSEYVRVNTRLAILQSEARLSLKRANPPS